jgi:outer membrane protein TolC
VSVFLLLVILFILSLTNLSFAENKPLTLDDSLAIAFKNSPQIISAREKLKAASAKLGQAVSLALPHLGAEAAYGRNYQQPVKTQIDIPGMPPMQFSSSPDEIAKITSYSATLKQNVFTGGKIWLAIEAADAADKLAREDLRKAEAELTYNVTEAYFNVIKARKILERTRETLASLKKYHRQMEIFYRAGLATKAEVLRVEAELAGMRTAEIQAGSGLQLALVVLNSLLGKNLSDEVTLAPQNFFILPGKNFTLDELLKIAYEKRPEWRAFLLGKKIAGSAVGYAFSGYLPNVALMGSIGKSVTDYSTAGKKYDLDNWRVVLAASWNIFDGLETPFKVAEAQANLAAVKAQEQIIKDALNLEVTSAFTSWLAAQEKLAAAQIAEDLARRAYRFALVNFNAHISTNLALLDAQIAWHQAQTNLCTAQFDLEISRVRLNKAVGQKVF